MTSRFYDKIDYIVKNYVLRDEETDEVFFKNTRKQDYFNSEYIRILTDMIKLIIKKVKKGNKIILNKVKNKIQNSTIRIPNDRFNNAPGSHLMFINLEIDKDVRPFEAAIQYYLKTQYLPPSSINQKESEITILFAENACSPVFIKNIVEEYEPKEGQTKIELGKVLNCVIRGEKQDKGIDWIKLIFNYRGRVKLPLIFQFLFTFRKIDADLLNEYRKKMRSNLSIDTFGQTKTSESLKDIDYKMIHTDSGHSLITDALCMADYKQTLDQLYERQEFKFNFCFHSMKNISILNVYPSELKKDKNGTLYFSYKNASKGCVPIPDAKTYTNYNNWKGGRKDRQASLNFVKQYVKENIKECDYIDIPLNCITFEFC